MFRSMFEAGMLASILAASCAATPAEAQSKRKTSSTVSPVRNDRALPARVATYMQAAVRNDQFTGAILVARNGVPIVNTAYGMASYELGVPNTPRTVFNIASITKQFTAMAIMQLSERGKLNVGDSICDYLSNCPAAWKPITIRNLLTHSSGIPNASRLPDWDESLSMRRYRPEEFVDLFRRLPLRFAPGEKSAYSNSGYFLLGLIIERASGMPYGEYLKANIFAPLGMTHSRHNDNRAVIPGAATGYYSRGTNFITATYVDPSTSLGDGGMVSTTGDLLRWDQALYSEKLVSRASLDAIFTPYKDGYGYGWEIGTRFGRKTISHSGSDAGFSSFILRVPDERLTVIILGNGDRMSAARAAYGLMAIVLGETYKIPAPQLVDMLWNTISQRGVDAAIAQYRQLRSANAADYNFGEETLLDLGYALIDARELDKAEAIFKLNIEMFPKAPYNYDGLGDVADRRGDRKAAIAHFERSLAMDPTNTYASDALKRLSR
ncbi:serine hydrolase [Sphingomonas sp. AOB5]|uniref:serine hydrolase n=1 Tax=Sphingomonas sp. AOB5 TaxID=3034017 RepID=UPI0023F65FED|nr:serine hydrolase [Sphingomonas sp. AOB5]MDF7775521.1 serine hydrolase [Sphingomonas sp. AOB5]